MRGSNLRRLPRGGAPVLRTEGLAGLNPDKEEEESEKGKQI